MAKAKQQKKIDARPISAVAENRDKIITKTPKSAKKLQKNADLCKKSRITSSAAKKLGRNSDGTFKKGNRESIGNKGGRPMTGYSARDIAKAMADDLVDKKNGGKTRLQKVIEILYQNAMSGDAYAIDKVVKLNGNYDPDESRISHTSPTLPKDTVYDELTADELRKFLGELK
jgi:hypothetical protein